MFLHERNVRKEGSYVGKKIEHAAALILVEDFKVVISKLVDNVTYNIRNHIIKFIHMDVGN